MNTYALATQPLISKDTPHARIDWAMNAQILVVESIDRSMRGNLRRAREGGDHCEALLITVLGGGGISH